jgi:hypothetical protein
MESDVISLQDIYTFQLEEVQANRTVVGSLVPTGLRPGAMSKFHKRGIELPQRLFGGELPAELLR